MTSYFLGLDAGNSKTVVLVADETGVVLGRGRGGSGDIYSARDAEGEVERAVRAALADAGIEGTQVRQAAFRLAGVDWPEDEAHWATVLAQRLPDLESVSIKNDGFSLLRCGSPDGVGVAINAGTGPAVAARGAGGAEYCACWWIAHPLGGRSLGQSAFRAVVDAELGIGPATTLTVELLALYGYPDVEALLHAFTGRLPERPVPQERDAARSTLRAAGAGDPVALGIVTEQTRTFARLGAVAARRTGLLDDPTPTRCVLGGSVLTSEHPVYRDLLAHALAAELGPVEVVASAASPVAGALLDALAEAGTSLDGRVHDQVLQVLHPVEFLRT